MAAVSWKRIPREEEFNCLQNHLKNEFDYQKRSITATAIALRDLLKNKALKMISELESIYNDKCSRLEDAKMTFMQVNNNCHDGPVTSTTPSLGLLAIDINTNYDVDFSNFNKVIEELRIKTINDSIKMPAPLISVGDEQEVAVTGNINKSRTFWLLLRKNNDLKKMELLNIQKRISTERLLDGAYNTFKESDCNPTVGDLVYVKTASDGEWLRGRVEQEKPNKSYGVRLCDYGEQVTVGTDFLLPAKNELFTNIEHQAVECCLMLDSDRVTLPPEAVWFFNDTINDISVKQIPVTCTFHSKILNKENNEIWQVELFSKDEKNDTISINNKVLNKLQDLTSGKDSIICRDIRYSANECSNARYVDRRNDISTCHDYNPSISHSMTSISAPNLSFPPPMSSFPVANLSMPPPTASFPVPNLSLPPPLTSFPILDPSFPPPMSSLSTHCIAPAPVQTLNPSFSNSSTSYTLSSLHTRIPSISALESILAINPSLCPSAVVPLPSVADVSMKPPVAAVSMKPPVAAVSMKPHVAAVSMKPPVAAVSIEPQNGQQSNLVFDSDHYSTISQSFKCSISTTSSATIASASAPHKSSHISRSDNGTVCNSKSKTDPIQDPRKISKTQNNIKNKKDDAVEESWGSIQFDNESSTSSVLLTEENTPAPAMSLLPTLKAEETNLEADIKVAEPVSTFIGNVTTDIGEDGHFWMHFARMSFTEKEEWNKMQTAISTCYNLTMVMDANEVVPGIKVIVRSTDRELCRGEVLEVKERKAIIRHIDFGKVVVLPRDGLKPLFEKIGNVPIAAVKCSIRLNKESNVYFDESARKKFFDVTKGKTLRATILDKAEGITYVQLNNGNDETIINEKTLFKHSSEICGNIIPPAVAVLKMLNSITKSPPILSSQDKSCDFSHQQNVKVQVQQGATNTQIPFDTKTVSSSNTKDLGPVKIKKNTRHLKKS